jgi:hypothetical protein
LLGVALSPSHLQRLAERIGREWGAARDADIAAVRRGQLPRDYAEAPPVAAVSLDGGRYQTRADGAGRGVTDRRWRETKVACCLTYAAPRRPGRDPQPRPPSRFLDRLEVGRLAAFFRANRSPGGRGADRGDPAPRRARRGRRRRRPASRRRVRTVVATTQDNEAFGWQVAAAVQRRGLDRARRKACLADGSKAIWALFALHLLASGFIGILDFVHLLVHWYAAASAAEGQGTDAAWALYQQWLCWAWSGQVLLLLGGLRAVQARLGTPPAGGAEEDPRQVVAEVLGYVENNQGRMDYARYRQEGLPISSAPVESVIKQLNRRVKGSEQFWLVGGAEAVLQVGAAYLSEDDRAARNWSRPRPYARAVGGGRLGRSRSATQ